VGLNGKSQHSTRSIYLVIKGRTLRDFLLEEWRELLIFVIVEVGEGAVERSLFDRAIKVLTKLIFPPKCSVWEH